MNIKLHLLPQSLLQGTLRWSVNFMLMVKTGYAYLFFFLYNSVNKVKNNILVQWKAVLMVALLEFIFIASLYVYAMDIFKFDVADKAYNFFLIFIAILLVGLKLWFFERNENWRKYISQFEAWPLFARA